MKELISFIEKNRRMLVGVLAVAVLVVFAFLPAADVVGKAKVSGFELVFKAKGIGFPRIVAILMLLAPLLIVLVDMLGVGTLKKLKGNQTGICFVACFLLALLLALTMPSGVSLAWGSWIYILLSLAGAAVSYIDKLKGVK